LTVKSGFREKGQRESCGNPAAAAAGAHVYFLYHPDNPFERVSSCQAADSFSAGLLPKETCK